MREPLLIGMPATVLAEPTKGHWFDSFLSQLEREALVSPSPRNIALLRIRMLQPPPTDSFTVPCINDQGTSLPEVFTHMLCESIEMVVRELSGPPTTVSLCEGVTVSLPLLYRVLKVYLALIRLDPVLGQEIGRQGSQLALHRLMTRHLLEVYDEIIQNDTEEEETRDNLVCNVYETATELLSSSMGSDSLKSMPYSTDELLARLPLTFAFPVGTADHEDDVVLINQVTSRQTAQEDVGFGKSCVRRATALLES